MFKAERNNIVQTTRHTTKRPSKTIGKAQQQHSRAYLKVPSTLFGEPFQEYLFENLQLQHGTPPETPDFPKLRTGGGVGMHHGVHRCPTTCLVGELICNLGEVRDVLLTFFFFFQCSLKFCFFL